MEGQAACSLLGAYCCEPPEPGAPRIHELPGALCIGDHEAAVVAGGSTWMCDVANRSGAPDAYLRAREVPQLLDRALQGLCGERPPDAEEWFRVWLGSAASSGSARDGPAKGSRAYLTDHNVAALLADAVALLDIARPDAPRAFLQQQLRLRAAALQAGEVPRPPKLSDDPRWPHPGPPPQRWAPSLAPREAERAALLAAAPPVEIPDEDGGGGGGAADSVGGLRAALQRMRSFADAVRSAGGVVLPAPLAGGDKARPQQAPPQRPPQVAYGAGTAEPGSEWRWHGGAGAGLLRPPSDRMLPWLVRFPCGWERAAVPHHLFGLDPLDAVFRSSDIVCTDTAPKHLRRRRGAAHCCCVVDALGQLADRIIAACDHEVAIREADTVFCGEAAEAAGPPPEVEVPLQRLLLLGCDDAIEGMMAVCIYTFESYYECGQREERRVRRAAMSSSVGEARLGLRYSGPYVDEALPSGAAAAAGITAGMMMLAINGTPTVGFRSVASSGDITAALTAAGHDFDVSLARLYDRPRPLQLRRACAELMRRWGSTAARDAARKDGTALPVLRAIGQLRPLLARLDHFIAHMCATMPPPPARLPFALRHTFRWRPNAHMLAAPAAVVNHNGAETFLRPAPTLLVASTADDIGQEALAVVATADAAEVTFALHPAPEGGRAAFLIPSNTFLQVLNEEGSGGVHCAVLRALSCAGHEGRHGSLAVERESREAQELRFDCAVTSQLLAAPQLPDPLPDLPAEVARFMAAGCRDRRSSLVVAGPSRDVCRVAANLVARLSRPVRPVAGRPYRGDATPPLLLVVAATELRREAWLRRAVAQRLLGVRDVTAEAKDAWRACRRRPLTIVALVIAAQCDPSGEAVVRAGGVSLPRSDDAAEWRLVLCLPSLSPADGGVPAPAAAAGIGAEVCVAVGTMWFRKQGAWAPSRPPQPVIDD